MFQGLEDRLARVRDEIARVQAAEGLTHPVTIVAVTKGHPPAAALAAARAGLGDVGENRVQEAIEKIAAAADAPVRWHLIGHVQTNKARFVPERFALVHSVDSARLAEALSRAAAKAGAMLPVLVQVNVAREPQKGGCPPAEAAALVARCTALPGLAVRGLMAMAPLTEDEHEQRAVFRGLRELRDGIATAECPLSELSMGMSGDYPAAVAEGATMLRLGTVLFGERTG